MSNFMVLASCFCFVFFAALIFCFKVKHRALDLCDIYFLLLAFYFGLYMILYTFYGRVQPHRPIAVLLTTLSVLGPILIVWLLFNVFVSTALKVKILRPLRIESLATNLIRVPIEVFFLVAFCLLAVRLYEISQFGLGWFYDAGTLSAEGYRPVYWITSLDIIYYPFLALVIVGIFSHCLLNSVNFLVKIGCFFGLFFALALSIFFRREGVFDFFLLIFVFFIAVGFRNISWFRALFWGAFCMLLLFYVTYIFQKNREYFQYQSVSKVFHENLKAKNNYTLSPGGFGFLNESLHEVGGRYPIWMFNYQIFDGMLRHKVRDSGAGEITYYAFRNTVPKLFWPNKKIVDIHSIPCAMYQFKCTQYDWNIYAFMAADFSWYYPLVAIAFLLVIFLSISFFLLKAENYPLLYAALLGFVLNFLLWIGQPYESIFLLYRNLAMITVVYFILRSIWRFGWKKRH